MPAQLPPNRLRELREARDLKVYDIAVLVRRDTSTIYGWETGEGRIPDDIKLELAEFYGVTAAYLMGWEDEPPTRRRRDRAAA